MAVLRRIVRTVGSMPIRLLRAMHNACFVLCEDLKTVAANAPTQSR